MNRKKWMGLATAVALTAAGATYAFAQAPGATQGGPPGGRQAMHERMCAEMPARLAGKMAFTEVKIGITAQQKPAWQKFTEDARAAMAPMQKRCEERAKGQAATPPTDPSALLARREQAIAGQLEMVKALHAAYDKLGPSLTADQKKMLAEMLARGGRHGRMEHHRGPMMGGQMGGPMGGPGGPAAPPPPAPKQ